jgi:hypothetical protein
MGFWFFLRVPTGYFKLSIKSRESPPAFIELSFVEALLEVK